MSDVKTVTSLDEFFSVLREYEIKTLSKFVCVTSNKAFTEEKFTPTENLRVHWNGDTPQYHIGQRVYACHQGKDRNLYQKRRYAEKRDSKAWVDHDFSLRRNSTGRTKKLDCPVVIRVSRVLALPNFKVSQLTKWAKMRMAETIKKKIKEGEEIIGENIYTFKLADKTSHQNHVANLHRPSVASSILTIPSSSCNPTDEDVQNDLPPSPEEQEYAELPSRKQNKTQLIGECNATIRSLQSTMQLLDEKKLKNLTNNLKELYQDTTLQVRMDRDVALPISDTETNTDKDKQRFGHTADANEKDVQLVETMIDEATFEFIMLPPNKKLKSNESK